MNIRLSDLNIKTRTEDNIIVGIKIVHLPTGCERLLKKRSITVKDRDALIKEMEEELS